MKRFMFCWIVCGPFLLAVAGCGEKASVKKETKVTTPGGTTTVTTEQEVKKTGDNPPPARP